MWSLQMMSLPFFSVCQTIHPLCSDRRPRRYKSNKKYEAQFWIRMAPEITNQLWSSNWSSMSWLYKWRQDDISDFYRLSSFELGFFEVGQVEPDPNWTWSLKPTWIRLLLVSVLGSEARAKLRLCCLFSSTTTNHRQRWQRLALAGGPPSPIKFQRRWQRAAMASNHKK